MSTGWLYKLLVFGGLVAIVAFTVLTALVFSPDRPERSLTVCLIGLTAWFGAYFAYWWFRILTMPGERRPGMIGYLLAGTLTVAAVLAGPWLGLLGTAPGRWWWIWPATIVTIPMVWLVSLVFGGFHRGRHARRH